MLAAWSARRRDRRARARWRARVGDPGEPTEGDAERRFVAARPRSRPDGVTGTTGSRTGSASRSSRRASSTSSSSSGRRSCCRNTTITGGDTGAHVWFPAYLRDHLLPWRVAGWSNDCLRGFPGGPVLLPVPRAADRRCSTSCCRTTSRSSSSPRSGRSLLPIGAYVFASRHPRAAAGAARCSRSRATALPVLQGRRRRDDDVTTTTSWAATLTSTLAGEYSFTIALACALFFLGTLAMRARPRGPLWLPARVPRARRS